MSDESGNAVSPWREQATLVLKFGKVETLSRIRQDDFLIP